MIEFLRRAAWLTPARAQAWLRILAATTAALVALWLALSHGGSDRLGTPLGSDFLSFYTASQLALSGHAPAAYDPAVHLAAQRTLFPGAPGWYAFFYPPAFLILCLPLATLPYLPALVAWLAAGVLALWAGLRRLMPRRWGPLPLLAMPALLVNASHGQNACLVAACFAAFAVLAPKRPLAAGLCLGLLVFKPHLLLAAPIMLLAGRQWRMIAGACLSAASLAAASLLVFGVHTWSAFLAEAPLARATLESGLVPPAKMQSVFAAVTLLHGPVSLAYAAQLAAALAAALILARTRADARAQAALLVCAAPLCTPFLLDYDLVILAIPLAWLASQAELTGWRPWEKSAALAAYLLPLFARPLATALGLPIAPLLLLALLLVIARRLPAPQPALAHAVLA